MEHMSKKLLIREGLAHQSAQRQILERLLFQEDVQTILISIDRIR
jgi:hypothetical protein